MKLKLFLRYGGFMKQEGAKLKRLKEDLENAGQLVELVPSSLLTNVPELYVGKFYPKDKIAHGSRQIENIAKELANGKSLKEISNLYRSRFFAPDYEERTSSIPPPPAS